jgi:hypothetical protein
MKYSMSASQILFPNILLHTQLIQGADINFSNQLMRSQINNNEKIKSIKKY